jgi:hypothetical protein
VAKPADRAKRTKEMNHVVTETSPGELGVGCSCGKRFPTQKAAELHASDQNLIEENEAKAKKAATANAQAAELAQQAKEPADAEPERAAENPTPAEILAGKEIGVTPFQAMTNVHIIQGKATMGANSCRMAAR